MRGNELITGAIIYTITTVDQESRITWITDLRSVSYVQIVLLLPLAYKHGMTSKINPNIRSGPQPARQSIGFKN